MEIIRKDQVYFADKDRHSGVFELFNLTDFPVRTNDNIRKAYLRKHCPAYVKGDSAATARLQGTWTQRFRMEHGFCGLWMVFQSWRIMMYAASGFISAEKHSQQSGSN